MARSHRKPTTLSATAGQAMVVSQTAIVLNRKFVAAVAAVYRAGNLHRQQADRAIELVNIALRPQRAKLVPWDEAAIGQALSWLADHNQIREPRESALVGAGAH